MGQAKSVITHVNVPTRVEKSRRVHRAERIQKWSKVIERETGILDRRDERIRQKRIASESAATADSMQDSTQNGGVIPRLPITQHRVDANQLVSPKGCPDTGRDIPEEGDAEREEEEEGEEGE